MEMLLVLCKQCRYSENEQKNNTFYFPQKKNIAREILQKLNTNMNVVLPSRFSLDSFIPHGSFPLSAIDGTPKTLIKQLEGNIA